ncbi:MAG: peptidase [Gammaproteobacteria bacterium]|nr:peptidase [Gammaproteobacteria bacterium]
MRWLILLHRYVGIAIGWLLVVWCLSGIVMMYVAFPELTAAERTRTLPPIDLSGCCTFDARDAALPLRSAEISMLSPGEPVLRLATAFGGSRAVRLRDGESIDSIEAEQALKIASGLASSSDRTPVYLGLVERDQWTVTAAYDAHRPLHLIAAQDGAGTEWYISSTTGEPVLATTRAERFWNWLGAVPHWLYPTLLRQNGPLWIQTVIWSSLVGAFLTAVGLYIGIARLKRRRSGRLSPYRGIALWHHYLGLVFGALVLTWVTSGLLSVNPWGLLDSGGARDEAALLRGAELTAEDVATWLDAASRRALPEGATLLELVPFDGAPQVLAHLLDGTTVRLRADTLEPAPLGTGDLARAALRLAPEQTVARADLLTSADAFYFEHHQSRPFPVYRVVLADAEATRYYIDATTGQLLQKVDAPRRWYRWLFEGLHRFDFAAALRRRPGWDLLMIALLAGATAVCATGTYMGIRFLLR